MCPEHTEIIKKTSLASVMMIDAEDDFFDTLNLSL